MLRKSRNTEFSKVLLIQESALIWIITISYIVLAFVCIICNYTGSLPWLSILPTVSWSAYGVSQGFYYNKAKAENTVNGIKYETVIAELQKQLETEEEERTRKKNKLS